MITETPFAKNKPVKEKNNHDSNDSISRPLFPRLLEHLCAFKQQPRLRNEQPRRKSCGDLPPRPLFPRLLEHLCAFKEQAATCLQGRCSRVSWSICARLRSFLSLRNPSRVLRNTLRRRHHHQLFPRRHFNHANQNTVRKKHR